MEDYIGKMCPFCKTKIKEGDKVKICPACGIPHHESCWKENGGCTTIGCPEQKPHDNNIANICSKCGASLDDDQEFCPNCGMPRVNICVKCGTKIERGQKFCPKCGQKVEYKFVQLSAKQKKKRKVILFAAIAVVAVALLGVFLLPKLFVSAEDLMAEGDYEKAYSVASGDERDEVLNENLIAYLCIEVADGLKDRSSFELRDAWYDKSDQRIVLQVGGKNSVGGVVTNFWYYTYDSDSQEYGLYCTVSDLDEEEIYSWDDVSESLEKMLYNSARETISEIISDSSIKLSKTSVKNINNLFQNDLLDSVELIVVDN